MANFTHDVKRDFLQEFPESKDTCAAALSALLNTAGYRSQQGDVVFVSENECVAEFFLRLTEVFAVRAELWTAAHDPKRQKDKLTFFCAGEEAKRLLLFASPETGAFRFAEADDTALAYLRAAFLGGGSCTLPRGGAKTGYHLEFSFSGLEQAESFCEVLETFHLFGKVCKRGDRFVVYLKSREAISDFLSVSGANAALKRFEEVSAEREESNRFNRVSNCFAGNADRSAIASAGQIVALVEMQHETGFLGLSDELLETARTRIENPTLSLSELSLRLGVSKSCLNHRLRKLMRLAQQIKDPHERN